MYRAFGVPWLKEDDHERLRSMTRADFAAFRQGRAGAMMRCNGSPFYPAKVADLIGIKERKYLDHTATHLHRGIGDLMRCAALVTFADAADFGPHHVLSGGAESVRARLPDEALYALALYVFTRYSCPTIQTASMRRRPPGRKFSCGRGARRATPRRCIPITNSLSRKDSFHRTTSQTLWTLCLFPCTRTPGSL